MKMLKTILPPLNSVYCIEIDANDPDKNLSILRFHNTGNDIQKDGETDWEKVNLESPILLSIRSSEILTRKFKSDSELENFLASLSGEDFLLQVIRLDGYIVLSLLHEKIFENHAKRLGTFQKNIVAVNLNESISFPYEENIVAQETKTDTIILNGEEITQNEKIHWLLAISYFSDTFRNYLLIPPGFDENGEEIFYRFQTFLFLRRILPYLLLLALLSAGALFILQKSNRSKQIQEEKLSMLKSTRNRLIEKRENARIESDEVLNKALIPISAITDILVSKMPEKIVLDEINIYPEINKDRGHSLFDNKGLIISGSAENTVLLQEWKNKIEPDSLFYKAEITHFQHNQRTGQNDFTLKIQRL